MIDQSMTIMDKDYDGYVSFPEYINAKKNLGI